MGPEIHPHGSYLPVDRLECRKLLRRRLIGEWIEMSYLLKLSGYCTGPNFL